MPRRGPWASRLLLAASATVLAFAAGEALLRTYLPIRPVLFELDSRLLYRHRAGARKRVWLPPSAGGGSMVLQINPEGRRGPRRTADGPPQIIVYGDSLIAAQTTPDDETLPAQLQSVLLERFGLATTVINAGVTGYGPDQVSLLMEDDLRRARPALVIVAVFAGNDFGDLLRNKLFRLDSQGGIQPNRWRHAPALAAEFRDAENQPRLHVVRAVLALRDRFVGLLRGGPVSPPGGIEARLAECRRDYETFVIEGDDEVRNILWDYIDWDLCLQPEAASSRTKRTLMAGVLARIRNLARDHEVPLLLVIIPAPHAIPNPAEPGDARRAAPPCDLGLLSTEISRIIATLSIPALDLLTPFRAAQDAPLYHYDGDYHWNPRGNGLAAELLAEKIVRDRLIRP